MRELKNYETMTTMIPCCDCKYAVLYSPNRFPFAYHLVCANADLYEEHPLDYVYGGVALRKCTKCETMRGVGASCGPDGRGFKKSEDQECKD